MDPREFLRIANQLAAGTDEAALRTAVGRFYYAAFLVARDKLGLTHERTEVHVKVGRELKRRNRAAGDKLFRLKDLRVQADYHLSTPPRNWGATWTRASSIAAGLRTTLAGIK